MKVSYFRADEDRMVIAMCRYPDEAVDWSQQHARERGLLCPECGWDYRHGKTDQHLPMQVAQTTTGRPQLGCTTCFRPG